MFLSLTISLTLSPILWKGTAVGLRFGSAPLSALVALLLSAPIGFRSFGPWHYPYKQPKIKH